MTTDTPNTSPASIETRRRPWLPWVIAAIVGILIGGVTVGVIAAQDDGPPQSRSVASTQLGSIREACAGWHDSYMGSGAPPAGWCDDMVGWMSDRMSSGQMMGSMMWSNPEQMRDTCQQWMSTTGSAGTNGSTWCGDMVDWMRKNMGDWDSWDHGWMMNGRSMMGG
jgi:hypothetical protein